MASRRRDERPTGLYVVQIANEALNALTNFLRGIVIVQENEVKRRSLSDDVLELGKEKELSLIPKARFGRHLCQPVSGAQKRRDPGEQLHDLRGTGLAGNDAGKVEKFVVSSVTRHPLGWQAVIIQTASA